VRRALKATELRLATEDELMQAGIVPGFASPVGLKGIKVLVDDSLSTGSNFVAGGNKPETHIKNVNYPRDFTADIVTNIATARAGEKCVKCGGKLSSTHGIEVGHVFKLGTFLSEKLGAYYSDEKGESHPIMMGCYGIGFGRLLAAAVEQNHDEKGIIWPATIAPFQVYLCPLYREGTKVSEVAEKLYNDLEAAGIEVLFDDRNESPGVKFNDADLYGIPLRVTVSPRTLEKNSVELKKRTEKASELVGLDGVVAKVEGLTGKS
jgi:prolyl-tRNA synthetase